MAEKIDIVLGTAPGAEGEKAKTPNPFIDSPAQFLAKWCAILIKRVPQFSLIFQDQIDAYQKDDYALRCLPALRIYDKGYTKEFDSWFITGTLYLDIILPASLRRIENQEVPDVLSGALLQQFRRPSFFAEMEKSIPGLNELGKTFEVDKELCFEWGENIVPLTQIRANFRIDLREWDEYLEQTDRTKDTPFEETLGNLETLAGEIDAYRNQEDIELTLGIEQKIGD